MADGFPQTTGRFINIPRVSGDWFAPLATGQFNDFNLPTGILNVGPWVADSTFTLAAIGVDVQAVGGVGCTFRPTIYNDIGGFPGALLLDAGPGINANVVAVGSITGLVLPISSGTTYWIGGVVQGGTSNPLIRCIQPAFEVLPGFKLSNGVIPASFQGLVSYNMVGIAGAAPNPFLSTTTGNAQPRLLFQVR